MNSSERVLAAFQGKSADRRAVTLTLSLMGAKLTGCPLQRYYTDPVAYARGQSAVYGTFKPDVLFGPFSLPLEGKSFGSEIHFFEDQVPNLRKPGIKDTADIPGLTPPNPDTDPVQNYFREAVSLMVKEHGQAVPVAAIALNPVDLPAMILGVEGWLETMLFNQDNTRRMLDITVPFFVQRVNSLFQAGAAVVILSTGFCNATVVTRQMAETWAIPHLKEAFGEVKGPLIIHSTGTKLLPFIDLFSPLPNVAGFVLDAGDDIAEARKKCGKTLTIIGNIDGPTLREGHPDRIAADCHRILERLRDDPHFILGTSGPDIPIDTPPENIHAIRDAVTAFGGG